MNGETPGKLFKQILDDPYAMPSTVEAARKLFNGLRKQIARRQRHRDRILELEARIAKLEASQLQTASTPSTVQRSGTG